MVEMFVLHMILLGLLQKHYITVTTLRFLCPLVMSVNYKSKF